MSSIEALTQFKNEHDGPLKLHVPLGERRRKSFLWSKKITCEEAFQNLKSSLSFVYAYEGSNEEKNGETAGRKGSILVDTRRIISIKTA